MRYLATIALVLLLGVSSVFAGKLKGIVKDADSGDALIGANVVLAGTTMGSTTDQDGFFLITDLAAGDYTVEVSYIGYQLFEKSVTVGDGDVSLDISLTPISLVGSAINVVTNRARERETPVAFTDVSKEKVVNELGSRDIPLVLNTTPSVYATQGGGGAGDARVNVRGFNQRNVAIMINGVPVNDMENGWVYWSNWDGVGDATSSIQMQRGLSAVNLATPSIGGTMNVITDPAAQQQGGKFRQEFGEGEFLKSTAVFNTGLIDDKFALSAAVVRKVGDGIINGTWTDAWAYYFGGAYNVNKNHRLELYALGAPQRHGQNLYRQNIGVYSEAFARSLDDYNTDALDTYFQEGRRYNQNISPVSPSYAGQQAVGDDLFDRFDPNFINERENFYHKPQVNLNWYARLNETTNLYSILYYSGGRGGGTGTFGSMVWDYSGATRRVDYDGTVARNAAEGASGSRGILRNSRNNQWTIGAISKLEFKASETFKGTVGIDWRTAEIEHYREVRDLLGGQNFTATHSDFWTESEQQRGLGDKIDYDNTNEVDWVGFFGQGEYTSGQFSAYGMAGYSTIKYNYTDFFSMADDGSALQVESDRIGGYQVKGGLGYRVNETVHAYVNGGFVSKVPIFDNVIHDEDGSLVEDPTNEKFTSLEAGLNFRLMDGKMNVKTSVYNTSWKDRGQKTTVDLNDPDRTEVVLFMSDVDALHQGVELEAAYQPSRLFRVDVAGSVGNWKNTDDVTATFRGYNANTAIADTTLTFYVKDLKVGDQPQTQLAFSGTLFPFDGMSIQGSLRHYRDFYADWDPFSRTDASDRAQSWKAPNYNLVDLHVNYQLPINVTSVRPTLFLHVFNLLDETYIQDATDNSRFNAYRDDGVNHKADDAEVFLGLPRFFNAGVQFNF